MPDTAQTVPLFGIGVGTKSSNVSAQMRTNLYVESYPDPDKSQYALFPRPGLTLFANSFLSNLPARCAVTDSLNSGGTELAAFVQGTFLNVYNSAGTLTQQGGPLSTSSGPVRAATIGTVSVMVDGTNGYFYDTSIGGASFAQILDPNFPQTSPSVAACASRIVAVDPSNIGRFRWSNAGDATTWNALDWATAESSPDPLSAVFEISGQLLLFGTQTIEFWSPTATGAANQQPYQRVGAANIPWGTTAIDTIRRCNDKVLFLGRNQGGNRQVVALSGYTAQVVSTPDVEYALSKYTNTELDAAVSWFTVITGHSFYGINLPDATWVFDLLTGTWAKWTTGSSRFAGQYTLPAFGKVLISDVTTRNIYYLDPDNYTDNGTSITREVVSRHAWANLARMSLRELRIDCETGVGLNTGQGSDPQIMLQWSKDGGHIWGNEVWCSLGKIGQYLVTPVWRNLGRARDWLFRVRVTDPVKVVIIGAAAKFQP